jgi:hypothetical protein
LWQLALRQTRTSLHPDLVEVDAYVNLFRCRHPNFSIYFERDQPSFGMF